VRKHQKTEDERFLYWADVKGLLVWSEMAAAYEYGDAAVSNFTREWMEIVRQNYNHPSIITWTPFNESWGIPALKTDTAQQHFTEAIYYLTKAYDPYRPVITNDGWEHTISDIVTLHDYEERGEDFFDRYSDLDAILDNLVYHNQSKSAFAQGYGYRGQPVIISEFGGIAFNHGGGWGYGNKVNTGEEFIKRFDAITTAIKKIDRICGYCYTQLTDVQQEINGIMDMDRNFKVDPDILKEINQRPVSTRYRMGR
jgi:beta-galactosidase/beta-glucuronidase